MLVTTTYKLMLATISMLANFFLSKRRSKIQHSFGIAIRALHLSQINKLTIVEHVTTSNFHYIFAIDFIQKVRNKR
jgi:hypothetical protein